MTTPTLTRDPKVDSLGINASREDALTLVASDSKAPSMNSSKRDLDKFSNAGDDQPTDDKVAEKDLEKQEGGAEPTEATAENGAPPNDGVLHGWKMVLVFSALMLVVFMFALDQSIVATAIPVVASQFQAFAEVPWLITAYFLTQCGFILLAGQLLTILKAKWVLLGAIFVFELGSLLCAVSNSMKMLIASRAIQGLGAAALFVSIIAIIAVITSVERRAFYFSFFGLAFVVSSVIGPLLGGVFTERLTWRWCFWINLPVGGAAAAAVLFFLPARDPGMKRSDGRTGLRALAKMDWIGSALVILFITCWLLALQWGGNNYPWSNWRIPVLFVFAILLTAAFFVWENWYGEYALMPKDILRNRTVWSASGAVFMTMLAMLGGTYQLPLFYQAGRAQSPQESGISVIPFMLLTCAGIMIAGGFVTKFGRYYPFILIGPPIAIVGFALLYTVRQSTPNARIIGFQVLAGFGIGLSFQNIILSVQAEYAKSPELIPLASGTASFFQLTGAAIGMGIVNTVQSVYLNKYIKEYAPEAPFELVRQSTSAIYESVPAGPVRDQVIRAYVEAISKSYIPIYIALALALVFGIFIRNHNMLKLGVTPGAAV